MCSHAPFIPTEIRPCRLYERVAVPLLVARRYTQCREQKRGARVRIGGKALENKAHTRRILPCPLLD